MVRPRAAAYKEKSEYSSEDPDRQSCSGGRSERRSHGAALPPPDHEEAATEDLPVSTVGLHEGAAAKPRHDQRVPNTTHPRRAMCHNPHLRHIYLIHIRIASARRAASGHSAIVLDFIRLRHPRTATFLWRDEPARETHLPRSGECGAPPRWGLCATAHRESL